MRKNLLIFLLLCLLTMGAQAQLKPRVVILTDIGQPDLEPDDTESLVHLLCYADQLEIEGIITSTGWNCNPYPTTNQRLYKNTHDDSWEDITSRFWSAHPTDGNSAKK